jgi:hypothetical protein
LVEDRLKSHVGQVPNMQPWLIFHYFLLDGAQSRDRLPEEAGN